MSLSLSIKFTSYVIVMYQLLFAAKSNSMLSSVLRLSICVRCIYIYSIYKLKPFFLVMYMFNFESFLLLVNIYYISNQYTGIIIFWIRFTWFILSNFLFPVDVNFTVIHTQKNPNFLVYIKFTRKMLSCNQYSLFSHQYTCMLFFHMYYDL